MRASRRYPSQRGAALVTALVFLLIVSVLGISSMRSSTMGLRMAQNEEARLASLQSAQGMTEAVIAAPAAVLVVGGVGFTTCTSGETGCDRYTLPVPAGQLAADVAAGHLSARLERLTEPDKPPPRVLESSVDKFSSAAFRVTATFDRADEGLGSAQLSEGILMLVPKE